MNTQEAIETIKNIDTLNINDMITGQQVDMVIKNQVLDIISQINEPQKPVVPQVAIDYYEQYKNNLLSLSEWLDGLYEKQFLEEFPDGDKLQKWLHDNDYKTNRQRELALATLIVNGTEAVQVEQEKLYTVEIPNPNIDKSNITVLKRTEDNTIELCVFVRPDLSESKFHLTESEIKKDFEWAWQAGFAKEVED